MAADGQGKTTLRLFRINPSGRQQPFRWFQLTIRTITHSPCGPLAGIGADGAKFVVVPEQYDGEVEIPEGFTELRSKTSLVVFFARDAEGNWFDGSNLYRLNVPVDAPAELFWSMGLVSFLQSH